MNNIFFNAVGKIKKYMFPFSVIINTNIIMLWNTNIIMHVRFNCSCETTHKWICESPIVINILNVAFVSHNKFNNKIVINNRRQISLSGQKYMVINTIGLRSIVIIILLLNTNRVNYSTEVCNDDFIFVLELTNRNTNFSWTHWNYKTSTQL